MSNEEHETITVAEAVDRGMLPKPITRVIVLNGPRGVGKDYIADMLTKYVSGVTHLKFSAVMKSIVALGIGMDEHTLDVIKLDKLFGKRGMQSYVDLQIELWQWLAERFGDEVLGRFAMDQVQDATGIQLLQNRYRYQTMIFSDGGRPSEVEWVADKLGRSNMLLVRLYRKGYTFEDDIRSYISLDGVETLELTNEGDEASARSIIAALADWSVRSFGKEQRLPPKEIDRISRELQMSILSERE